MVHQANLVLHKDPAESQGLHPALHQAVFHHILREVFLHKEEDRDQASVEAEDRDQAEAEGLDQAAEEAVTEAEEAEEDNL